MDKKDPMLDALSAKRGKIMIALDMDAPKGPEVSIVQGDENADGMNGDLAPANPGMDEEGMVDQGEPDNTEMDAMMNEETDPYEKEQIMSSKPRSLADAARKASFERTKLKG